jgi:hypothetical protein
MKLGKSETFIITDDEGVVHVISLDNIERAWFYFDNLDSPKTTDLLTKIVILRKNNKKEFFNIPENMSVTRTKFMDIFALGKKLDDN